MSNAGEAIYSILSGDTDVAAIVSARIYPEPRPQGKALPNISYQEVSCPRVQVHSGPAGTAYPRYQINYWADTYTGAKALAEKGRIALDGYSGTAGGVTVQAILLEDEGDIPTDTTQTQRERTYGVRQDFIVWHRETFT